MNADYTVTDRAMDLILTEDMRRENARPFARETFTCWAKRDGDAKASRFTVSATTLPEIEREIAAGPYYGMTVLVLGEDTIAGTKLLHVYRIRRGKWLGRTDPRTFAKVYPHTADKLFSMPVRDFSPVEPWRWTPGCDVVGHTNIIEGAA